MPYHAKGLFRAQKEKQPPVKPVGRGRWVKRWVPAAKLPPFNNFDGELLVVIDQIADLGRSDVWFIGPTKFDESMLPMTHRLNQHEIAIFHQWKEIDLNRMMRERCHYQQSEFPF